MNRDYTIRPFSEVDADTVLKLLIDLHETDFRKKANAQLQELSADKNLRESFRKYLESIIKDGTGNWKIFLATSAGETIGFIIGSFEEDGEMVLGRIGKIEDWFVQEEFRGKSIGIDLLNKLEAWFLEKGCSQIHSDTWQGNEEGTNAHLRSGFFISGIKFRKKIGS